jgi:hypothetical protein
MFVYILHNVSEKFLAYFSGQAVLNLNPSEPKFSHIALGAHKSPTMSLTYQPKSGIYKFTLFKNLTKPNDSIAICASDSNNDGIEEFIITQNSNKILYYTYDLPKNEWNYIKIRSPYEQLNSSITKIPNGFLVGNTANPPFIFRYNSLDKKVKLDRQSVVFPDDAQFHTRSILNFKGLFKGFDGLILNASNKSYQLFPQYSFNIKNDKIEVNNWISKELVNSSSATFVNINPSRRIYGLLVGNFGSAHILYLFKNKKYIGQQKLIGSYCNCVYAADFDNDGNDEIFILNYKQYNQLYRVENENTIQPIQIGQAYTGLYYNPLAQTNYISTITMDLDEDGLLEVYNTSGDSFFVGNSLLKPYEMYKENKFIRVYPINQNGSPHRGAIVSIKFEGKKYKRIIDNGGNAYSQSEPIAHFGLGKYNSSISIKVKWTDGTVSKRKNERPNQVVKIIKEN